MKLKRLLSCALALALALTLTAQPASAAAAFPDIQKHWAKDYIEIMTAKGMFKGYEDGNFKPENKLTTAEALALCARAVPIDTNVGTKMGDTRNSEVKQALAGQQTWFYREFGICLETGILTLTELQQLYTTGALTKAIAKEDLSRYLIRAMQLGPMADRLTSYGMSFVDTATIAEKNQPYVYLLNIYGIVQGDEKNAFGPRGDVTRAVMATMLSRAIDFMSEREISPDLPGYTSYDVQAGVIAAVTTGGNGAQLLTLTNNLTGLTSATVSLNADAMVYENNMKSTTSALKVGRHVRLAIDGKGAATQARVSGSLDSFTGSVNGIENNSVALTVDGEGRMVTMDRFTQVQIGTKSNAIGGMSLVDENAGYTNALCKVDDQGRLVAIQFTGGTREESGILAGVEKGTGTQTGNTILRVIGFDGVTHQYNVPATATVLLNGVSGTLTTGNRNGSYVTVRLSDEENTAVTVVVDTVTKYAQGAVKGTTLNNTAGNDTITISDINTGKSTTYYVATGAAIFYNNETTLLRNIKNDYFVTVQLSGNEVTRLDAYPGSAVTQGVLSNRTFDTTGGVLLEVKQADETVVTFHLTLTDLPAIYRNEDESTIDKLRMGDTVVITVRYSRVTRIEATPQEANEVGVINRVILENDGTTTLEMTLADGTEVNYTVNSFTGVTVGGKAGNISSLKPGQRLAMVVNGDEIASIDVQQSATVDGQMVGTVVYPNVSSKEIVLRITNAAGTSDLVTVKASNATFMEWDATVFYLRDLKVGDTIQVNGEYSGADFVAKLILRR